jgi:prepilin-type N-terminal cleavage/methylation domain-containing protein
MAARTYRARPAGFTLIELLVVISIIGVLASLLMAAVMRVRGAGNEARAKSEIRQLETNINGFRAARRVDYLPSFGGGPNNTFRLRKVYLYPATLSGGTAANPDQGSVEFQYLIQVFPGLSNNKLANGSIDIDPSNTVPASAWGDYDNNQILIFFLTGGEVTQYQGFSNDASRPFDTSAGSMANRTGKYFDIPFERIQTLANGTRTSRYLDPWGTPYVYMTSDGKTYPLPTAASDVVPQALLLSMGVANQPTGINPFRSLTSGTNTKAINDRTFQIISAGPNKIFGRGSYYVSPNVYFPYTPGASPYTDKDPGGDDFANFRNLKLSASSD